MKPLFGKFSSFRKLRKIMIYAINESLKVNSNGNAIKNTNFH